jgi:glycosyltransferase involved in cell wall biosynthesis
MRGESEVIIDEKQSSLSNEIESAHRFISSLPALESEISQGKRLVVTIPAFNEEKTIGAVIASIPRDLCDDVKVLVVDDGSRDKTVQAAFAAGADKVLSHVHNLGLAITFRDALDEALAMGADVIVNIDADGQYEPKEIVKLITPIRNNTADIVCGSRFAGTIEEMPASKKIGNKVATRVVSQAAGQHFTDCQTGFRAFSRDAALRLNIMSDFTYTQETLVQAVNKNLRISEVPVNFYKREGESRLFPSVWSYAKRAGSTLIRTYLYHKPLKTFLYIGGVVFVAGLLLGLRVLLHYLATGQVTPFLPTSVLSAVLLIVGFQVIILGLIADLIRRNQNVQEEILYRLKKENGNR